MHAMRPFGRTLATLAIAATTTLAACSDSTGPDTVSSIDADVAAAKIAPIAAVFEQSAFESMMFAGDYFASAPTASLAAVSKLTASLRSGRSGDASAILLARSATAVVSADVVPETVKGNTYVYDPSAHDYVLSDATGAPANGIRIVLYAWDALAGAPASPLARIGYVDLIDQSTASSDALRVRVVRDQGSATLADYVISYGVTASSETFGINGSASNATTTVNFGLNASVTGAEGAEKITAAFDVSVPALGYSVGLQTSVDLALERATSSLSVGYDGHVLTFDQTATATSVQGEVKYDGRLYATFTATYNETTGEYTERFVKANGDPLTQRELAELGLLFERAFDLGGFWIGLLWPVYAFV
jgi:hypothetical protein